MLPLNAMLTAHQSDCLRKDPGTVGTQLPFPHGRKEERWRRLEPSQGHRFPRLPGISELLPTMREVPQSVLMCTGWRVTDHPVCCPWPLGPSPAQLSPLLIPRQRHLRTWESRRGVGAWTKLPGVTGLPAAQQGHCHRALGTALDGPTHTFLHSCPEFKTSTHETGDFICWR